jgi:hypothetical protein
MGKRELLLIIVFVVIGAVVYQATAPPPAPGERSFSLGGMIESLKRHVRGNPGSADVATTSTHPVDPGVTEVRVVGRTEVTVTGEDRADIGAELNVHSNGFDDAEAQQLARQTLVKIDRAGGRLIATVNFPDPGSQRARLALKIPSRLLAGLDSTSGRMEVTGVAGVELLNTRGEAQIRKIAGRVTGTHRGGTLAVADSGPVKLTTFGSDVRLERIRNEVTITTRGGDLKGSELAGPIDVDANGADIELEKLEKTTGIVRINAAGGSVSVKGLRTEGRIDVRGAEVEVIVDRAAPLSIYSDGGNTVDLTPPAGGYQLDAVATNASISVADDSVPVVTNGQERRASGAVKGGGPTITIRSGRGPINVRAR